MLNDKISKSWKKEIAKRKELEEKVKDATVFVKQSQGLQKISRVPVSEDDTAERSLPEVKREDVAPMPDPDAFGDDLKFEPPADGEGDMPEYFEASTILCDPEHVEEDGNVGLD